MGGILFVLVTSFFMRPANLFSQTIRTLDGVEMGDRSRLIDLCVKGADAADIEYNGISFSTLRYCNCVVDNVFPTILSNEIVAAVENNSIQELLFQEDRLDIMLNCLENNVKFSDDYKISSNQDNELTRIVGVRQCVREIVADKDQILNSNQAEKYCECAVDRIIDMGYTYGEINQIENENSNIFNEVIVPCMNDALQFLTEEDSEMQKYNGENLVEVIGLSKSVEVPLTDYMGQGYKLKLNIGGVESYFLLDTSASNILIDRKIERELLLSSSIKREDYLDESTYIMANNESVVAQNVILREIKVGNYTVKNVKAAIINDGSLLCGQSFLESFSKWEINKYNKTLTLYK